MTEFQRYI